MFGVFRQQFRPRPSNVRSPGRDADGLRDRSAAMDSTCQKAKVATRPRQPAFAPLMVPGSMSFTYEILKGTRSHLSLAIRTNQDETNIAALRARHRLLAGPRRIGTKTLKPTIFEIELDGSFALVFPVFSVIASRVILTSHAASACCRSKISRTFPAMALPRSMLFSAVK